MNARPTLKDVAELAGVSFKTMSRVLNGENGVSPAMHAKVQQAVDTLGYRRNHSAQALRKSGQSLGVTQISV